MPIKGKTDAGAFDVDSLQVVYRLWKGTKKKSTGRKDSHGKDVLKSGEDLLSDLRFESSELTEQKFAQMYGSVQVPEVRIYLPYATTDQCFPTWMEAYTAQGFKHRCDGERIIQEKVQIPYQVKARDGMKTQYRWERQDCDKPCAKGDKPVCPDCGMKGVGRLFFYVQELYAAGMGSTKCGMLSVSNVQDVVGLTKQLRGLEQKYGDLHSSPFPCPWTYGYIPYILTRIEKPVMKPVGDRQVAGTAWVLSISEDPEWLSALQRFQQAQEVMRLKEHPEVMKILLPNVKIAGQLPSAPEIEPQIDNSRAVQYQQINAHLKRAGIEEADYLRSLYNTSSRYDLDDYQLDDYLAALKRLPNKRLEQVEAIATESDPRRDGLMSLINLEFLRLMWGSSEGNAFLKQHYGKPGRANLSTAQLEDCLAKMRSLPSPTAQGEIIDATVVDDSADAMRRLKAIAKCTGHGSTQIMKIAEHTLERDFKDRPITRKEVRFVRDALLLDKAASEGTGMAEAAALLEALSEKYETDDEIVLEFMGALQREEAIAR